MLGLPIACILHPNNAKNLTLSLMLEGDAILLLYSLLASVTWWLVAKQPTSSMVFITGLGYPIIYCC